MCQRLFHNIALPRPDVQPAKSPPQPLHICSHKAWRSDLCRRWTYCEDRLTTCPYSNTPPHKQAAAVPLWLAWRLVGLCSHLSVFPLHQSHSAESTETYPHSWKSQQIKLPPLWIKFDLSIIQMSKGSSQTGNLMNLRSCCNSAWN